MSEVVSPSRKSHRRLLIILAAVLGLVIAIVVGSYFYASSVASSKVSDYKHDFAAWEAKDESALLAATAALPTDTYVTSSDPGTTAALTRQKRACGEIASSLKDVKRESDRIPELPSSGLLKRVSSDYQAAGDMSDHRARVIRAYAGRASAILAQLERDCSWNIAWNAAYGEASALYKKSETYTSKSEPGFICDAKEGCISSIAVKKNAFADLRIKAAALERKTTLKQLQSADCRATSYGEACRTLANSYSALLGAELAYDKYVRASRSSVGDSGIDVRVDKLVKVEKKNLVANRKAVLALNPHLKDDKDVVSDPTWSDNFFEVMAKMRLAELDGQRLALERL